MHWNLIEESNIAHEKLYLNFVLIILGSHYDIKIIVPVYYTLEIIIFKDFFFGSKF